MTDDNIPVKCPQCGCPTLRVEVVTWAVYRDGKMDGIIVGDTAPARDGAVICDNDDCIWELR